MTFVQRSCGKEARQKLVHNFQMAFGGKERKSKHKKSGELLDDKGDESQKEDAEAAFL